MDVEHVIPLEVTSLPDEILQQIFTFLSLEEILCCERVCRRWKRLIADPFLFRNRTVSFNCNNITENVKTFLSLHGTHVRNLRLYDINDLGDITFVLTNCNNLTALEMPGCVVNAQLENVIASNKDLRELALTCDVSVLDCIVNDLIEYGSHLKFQYDGFTHLRKLRLYHSGLLNEANRESLLRCALRHVELCWSAVLDAPYVARLLAALRATLEHFRADHSARVDELAVRQLALCARLKYFSVDAAPAKLAPVFRKLFPSFRVTIETHNYAIHLGQYFKVCLTKI